MTAPVIGILGWNSAARLDRCLRSVLATMPENCRVQVWDNGPSEVPVTDARVEYRYCNAATGGEFTAALRLFLIGALEDRAPVAVWCNDDLDFEPGCLTRMIEAARRVTVGLACPMQVAMNNPAQIICGGTGAAFPQGIHRIGARANGDWKDAKEVRWMPFAAVAFNMTAVQDVGLPDGSMRLWFSDSDYCIRCRYHGYAVQYLGAEAVVRHEQSASINEARAEREDAMRERFMLDQAHFRRKWGGQVLAEYSS